MMTFMQVYEGHLCRTLATRMPIYSTDNQISIIISTDIEKHKFIDIVLQSTGY